MTLTPKRRSFASTILCLDVAHSDTDLFGYIEIEDHHTEVVDYKCLPERVWLASLHVYWSCPQKEQVQAADGQSGEGRRHHGPALHPLVWKKQIYIHV